MGIRLNQKKIGFRPQSSARAFLWAKLGLMNFSIATHLKFTLLLQWGNQHFKIFSGTPIFTIFGAPKYVPKYAYLAKYAYLGAPDMVKWSVPEKILQNVVQTHCS